MQPPVATANPALPAGIRGNPTGVWRRWAEERTSELNTALVECLENELAMRRAIATGEIPPIPWDASHDFVLILMREVRALGDPAHIPLFANLIEYGPGVSNWLVSFGRLALPALFARIDGTQPALENEISGVMTTLRFMIEAWGLEDLTAEEQAGIRRVAVQYMNFTPGQCSTQSEYSSWRLGDQT